MRLGRSRSVSRWLFYFAIGASWLLGAEIVVLTAAKESLPGHVPHAAGWVFVGAMAVSVIAIGRLEMTSRQQTATLVVQLEEALGSITALTEASLSSLELPMLLDHFLERLDTVLHAQFSAILLLSDARTDLVAVAARGLDVDGDHRLRIAMSENDGLIGRVVVTELPIVTRSPQDLAVLAAKVGLRLLSAAACPILVEGNLIGVCVAATTAPVELGEREMHLLQLVADRSGLGIERRRLDDAERRSRLEVERARRQALMLATVSATLATARDDYRDQLVALVDVVVPQLAQWCAIDLVDASGARARLAIRHGDDTGPLCSDELRQELPEIDAVIDSVMSSGRSRCSPVLTEVAASGRGEAPGAPEVTEAMPWLVVPILSAARLVGAMTLVFDDDDVSTDGSELASAEDIARRIAVTVDRVDAYLATRELATRSRLVASQLEQLLDASLEVSRLFSETDVLSAIVARGVQVWKADCAVVTLERGDEGARRAVAAPGRAVEVGAVDEVTPPVPLPEGLGASSGTVRGAGWLAAPIVGRAEEPVGSVAIARAGEFSSEDETILVLLAQTASTALASVALYRTIQEREARWRALVEAAPIGIMEVDVAGTVRWENRAAQEIFAPGGAHATPADLPEAHLERLRELWSRAIAGGEVRDEELLEVLLDGNAKDLLVSIVPLFANDSTVQGVLTLASDISDRRRLEAELRQVQRMEAVSQLAGNVAHDFNNLLTLITGYTELLRAHQGLDARALDLVRSIQEVTDRAALMTGRLLTISRQEAAQPILLDPTEALASMREVLARILGERTEVRLEFAEADMDVLIDPGYFDQLILNLAVNARDAMPEGGTFSVRVSPVTLDGEEGWAHHLPPGDYVELVVADTGSGMDDETAARCFEPFFTTKGPLKGTGLGLAAVRGVVTESGGSIEVASSLGVGTTFVLRLPKAASAAAEAGVPDGGHVAPEDFVVLVVDDDEPLRALIRKVLTTAGYEVLSAPDGEAALQIVRGWSGPIDLLLTDVTMPGLSGIDLATEVVGLRPSTGVLFISSNLDSVAIPGHPDRRSWFLPKPFRPSQLVELVNELSGVLARPLPSTSG